MAEPRLGGHPGAGAAWRRDRYIAPFRRGAAGEPLILDEDEFAVLPLSDAQRAGARRGLQALLAMLEVRRDAFAMLR